MMAYNNYFPMGYQQSYPQFQQPQYQQPQANQPSNGIVWVQGIEGAKAHPVQAGQAVLLMDSDANCLYLKSADQTGMPTLRIFDYTERRNTPQKVENEDLSAFARYEDLSLYATKKDLKNEIESLKKHIEEMVVNNNEQSDI